MVFDYDGDRFHVVVIYRCERPVVGEIVPADAASSGVAARSTRRPPEAQRGIGPKRLAVTAAAGIQQLGPRGP